MVDETGFRLAMLSRRGMVVPAEPDEGDEAEHEVPACHKLVYGCSKPSKILALDSLAGARKRRMKGKKLLECSGHQLQASRMTASLPYRCAQTAADVVI
ncbi:hypothetical protein AB1Y20_002817 [Prymnesium parvum]|uniref:DDE-1 domain-containing protein n=1 Tax=Prymnesium parvum TaxID=97485 RepID=A0AB34JC19_PRYPA